MGDVVQCRAGVLAAIAAHVEREAPRECCGLLLGRGDRIDEALPLDNRAAEPARRYEIDPRDYLEAVRRCRGTGQSVIGAYHSHPRTPAEPSETDRAEAFGGFLYVIAGPATGGEPLAVRAYRLDEGNFRRVPLVPDPEEACR